MKSETLKAPTKKTEIKAKKFVRDYIESGLNASAAARKNFNISRPDTKGGKITAAVIGNEYLNKPYTKALLREALEEKMSDDDIGNLLQRNARQNKNISASNQALDIAIKVKGGYAPERKLNLNLDMSDSALEERLRELRSELDRIREAEDSV